MQRGANDIEGYAIRIDLNRGRVPRRLRGAYDLVVNGGTTEHIANQMNAFRIIHNLVRVGGVMYHELPAGGLVDHSLVSYQPTNIRYTALGPSKLPDYLRKANPHGGDSVVDCSLRVAQAAQHARSSARSMPATARCGRGGPVRRQSGPGQDVLVGEADYFRQR
jgi:hypothetical protein